MSTVKNRDFSEHNTQASVTAEIAIAAAIAQHELRTIEIGTQKLYLDHAGHIIDLDKYRTGPLRHSGIQSVADVVSFLHMVNRHEAKGQMIRMSLGKLTIESIFNYGLDKAPGFKDHSIVWTLKHDPRLAQWLAKNGKPMCQTEFMEFLEDRLEDVIQHEGKGPTQSSLQSVISDLEVTTESKFTSKRNLQNGSYVYACSSDEKASISVPERFWIALPIFDGARDRYPIPIRMRYRVQDGKLSFTILFHDWQTVLDTAWKDITDDITKEVSGKVECINVP